MKHSEHYYEFEDPRAGGIFGTILKFLPLATDILSGLSGNGIRASGIKPSGIKPSGIKPSGIRPSGIRASGIGPSGIKASGVSHYGYYHRHSSANAKKAGKIALEMHHHIRKGSGFNLSKIFNIGKKVGRSFGGLFSKARKFAPALKRMATTGTKIASKVANSDITKAIVKEGLPLIEEALTKKKVETNPAILSTSPIIDLPSAKPIPVPRTSIQKPIPVPRTTIQKPIPVPRTSIQKPIPMPRTKRPLPSIDSVPDVSKARKVSTTTTTSLPSNIIPESASKNIAHHISTVVNHPLTKAITEAAHHVASSQDLRGMPIEVIGRKVLKLAQDRFPSVHFSSLEQKGSGIAGSGFNDFLGTVLNGLTTLMPILSFL